MKYPSFGWKAPHNEGIFLGCSLHTSSEACRFKRYNVQAHSSLVIVPNTSQYPVDRLEQMLGSYGPNPTEEPYSKDFDPEESPSGMLARSGTYNVVSRVVDDDGEVYAGKHYRPSFCVR